MQDVVLALSQFEVLFLNIHALCLCPCVHTDIRVYQYQGCRMTLVDEDENQLAIERPKSLPVERLAVVCVVVHHSKRRPGICSPKMDHKPNPSKKYEIGSTSIFTYIELEHEHTER
jgi:hypothetical protein